MPHYGASTQIPSACDAERWLGAGIAVFQGSRDAADFPPLDDREAQRHWVAGFGAAWAECPDGAGGLCDEEVDVALMRALDDHRVLCALLLRGHCPADRVLH